jgi:iron complex transport system ATP-binding protein
VMNLARAFADAGGGVVAVMHDLNLTAMFADQVALISNGQIIGAGTPRAILTDTLLSQAYDCSIRVNAVPTNGTFILPHLSVPGVALPPSH